jgi:hypothetical protein
VSDRELARFLATIRGPKRMSQEAVEVTARDLAAVIAGSREDCELITRVLVRGALGEPCGTAGTAPLGPPHAEGPCAVREARTEVTHLCPPDGMQVTPCCGMSPFDLPRTDRMTGDPSAVSCYAATGAKAADDPACE